MKTRILAYTSHSPTITAKTFAKWLKAITIIYGRITSVEYRESETEHVIEATVEEGEE